MNLVNVLNYCTSVINAGGGAEAGVPTAIGNLVHLGFIIIQVVVPILLIIWGMLDFAKSVIAKNEDDVKKYRKSFISRVISAIIVFLIVFVVQLAVNLIASVEDTTNENGQTVSDIWSCSKKFINGVNN